jgi:hypothetical protein
MGERLTDEELNAMARGACECRPLDFDRDSHSHDCDDLYFRGVAELRERRAQDLTSAEVDAIRELRACFGGTHYTDVTKRALAVLDRLLNQESR